MEHKGLGMSHGKIILIGEHSVVYNQPAIAMPIGGTFVETLITEGNKGVMLDTDLYRGILTDAPDDLSGIVVLINHLLKKFAHETTALDIKINSNIPTHRGLGSSAAVSVSLIKALYDYFKVDLTQTQLRTDAMISESIHHTNPSGLDVEAMIQSRPIFYQKQKAVQAINTTMRAYLVVGDSGVMGKTSQAVKHVYDILQSHPSMYRDIDELGALTHEAMVAMTHNNAITLGNIFNQAQVILKRLGVSHPQLDHLNSVALDAGALGAKLTGSGQGGCMIALCSDLPTAQNVAQRLKEAGAIKTYLGSMEEINE